MGDCRNCRSISDCATLSDAEVREDMEYFLTQAAYRQQLLNERACPWNRLPTEILARVFLFCRPSDWGHFKLDQRLRSFMRLTNVCSRWRTVAIHTPELWAIGPCWSPNRMAKILERAKEAPLELKYTFESADERRVSVVLDFLQRIHRIKHIDLEYDSTGMYDDTLQTALSKPALNLEHLRVEVGSSTSWGWDSDPVWLFEPQTPNLRHLSLNNCGLRSWEFLRFPDLRALHLNRVKSLSLQHLMNSLTAMPALEYLRLRNAMRDSELSTDILPTLQLPSLRTLLVNESVTVISCFVKRLLAVQLSQIDFECIGVQRTSDVAALISGGLFSDSLVRLKSQLVSANINSRNHGRNWSLAVSSSPALTWFSTVMPSPAFRIQLNLIDCNPYAPGSVETPMLSLLGKLQLRTLSIAAENSTSRSEDKAMWMAAFPMPYASLRELQINGSVAAGVIDALGQFEGFLYNSKQVGQPGFTPCFFFGGLQTLHLERIDHELQRDSSSTLTLRELLLQNLEMRCNAGLPLHRLGINCVDFAENDKDDILLGGWAQDVTWDQNFPEDEDYLGYDEAAYEDDYDYGSPSENGSDMWHDDYD